MAKTIATVVAASAGIAALAVAGRVVSSRKGKHPRIEVIVSDLRTKVLAELEGASLPTELDAVNQAKSIIAGVVIDPETTTN